MVLGKKQQGESKDGFYCEALTGNAMYSPLSLALTATVHQQCLLVLCAASS